MAFPFCFKVFSCIPPVSESTVLDTNEPESLFRDCTRSDQSLRGMGQAVRSVQYLPALSWCTVASARCVTEQWRHHKLASIST